MYLRAMLSYNLMEYQIRLPLVTLQSEQYKSLTLRNFHMILGMPHIDGIWIFKPHQQQHLLRNQPQWLFWAPAWPSLQAANSEKKHSNVCRAAVLSSPGISLHHLLPETAERHPMYYTYWPYTPISQPGWSY